jgi:nucleoside-diphosphate-sugar epimerase
MKVFVTGATGFVGSAVIQELIKGGHTVLGLARNEANAEKLKAAGAEVHRGDLEDLESLRAGAAASDGVIHTGFIHDFTRFAEVCEIDRVAIETMGEVLVGSDRPFLVTSGTAHISVGVTTTEDMMLPANHNFPRKSEPAADALAARGVRISVIRLSPSVHGVGDHHGFVPILIRTAREKKVSAFIGDGQNRWNAVHRLDAAHLYKLALENAVSGKRFHAVGEEGIPFKLIAEAIGKQENLPVVSIAPEKAAEHFGWFTGFASLDIPASSKVTQETLKWKPTHQALLKDLAEGVYSL